MSLIDNFLNSITMYRLVLYYLLVLWGVALIYGIFGILPYSPLNLTFSTSIILAVCWLTNLLFAKIFSATTNVESFYITAFILVLIIAPVPLTNTAGIGFLVFASAAAMASKYIFAISKKHFFNPAAFGVAASALLLGQTATWWVAGNLPLMPFVVVGGLLIVRKIHRFDLFLSFSGVALITIFLTTNGFHSVNDALFNSVFFFLAFVMLTEPVTTPPTRMLRIFYGAIVGFLFAPDIRLGSFYFTPELALLAGNVFSYVVSPKGRFTLTLREKRELAKDTYEYVFAPNRRFHFEAGQYLEWTLAHHPSDSRGNRRYFTIASSPTELDIRLGAKFYDHPSSFKNALSHLPLGATLSVGSLAGDFTLPKDKSRKLVFIAGGIGVTPFRSHVEYLMDTHDSRTVTLFYSNKTRADIAYKDVFDTAREKIGLKTVYTFSHEPQPPEGMHGPMDAALIAAEVPDYKKRLFYISGPHVMVEAFKKTLRNMGVPRFQIKTDYFPGYA